MPVIDVPRYRTTTGLDIVEQGFNQPLSFGDTFRETVADTFNRGYGVGYINREINAPDLARDIAPGSIHLLPGPIPLPNWGYRYHTREEVEARGDRLFENEQQMKASPYYRKDIPWERGLTESRLRYISEEHDLSMVRQYYATKRPLTAFIAGLTGAALEPSNYIPIFGQIGAARSVATFGPILGRALIGAREAALNAGILGVLSASGREKWGEEATFRSIATEMGYAAFAGAIFGSAFGAVERYRNPRVQSQMRTLVNERRAGVILNDAIDSFITEGDINIRQRHFFDEAIREFRQADLQTHGTVDGRLLGEVRGFDDRWQTRVKTKYDNINVDGLEEWAKLRRVIDRRTVTLRDLEKIDREEIDGILQGTIRLAAEYASGERKMPAAGTFLGWLRANGGIKDTGGDVAAIIGTKKRIPGLFNPNGKDVDEWGSFIKNAFPEEFKGKERLTAQEVRDLIDDASRDVEPPWFEGHRTTVKQKEALDIARDIQKLQNEIGTGLKTKEEIAALFKSDAFQSLNDLAKREDEMGKSMPVRYENPNYARPSPENYEPMYEYEIGDAASSVDNNVKAVELDDEINLEIARAEAEGIDIETGKSDLDDEVEALLTEEGLLDAADVERFRKEMDEENANIEAAKAYNDALDTIKNCAVRT